MSAEGSSLALVDALIIGGFLVTVCTIGYVSSKAASKNIDEFFLGGKKLPWWLLGVSSAAANLDMSGTMIIAAVVFSLGYKGLLVEIRGGATLCMAFLMITVGKWLRRSRVMTSAEWMKIRFGIDRPGRAAHLLSALANIILSLGMIIYFCKGSGKFLVHFLPVSEFTATSLMVAIGLFYTVMAGLRGVVFTDMVQMLLIVFTTVIATYHGYVTAPEVTLPPGFLGLDLTPTAGLGGALAAKDPLTWNPLLGSFGLAVLVWSIRTTLEGMGGVGGYTDQRFFAAHSERDAGLLTLESVIVSMFRWTMVAGLVIMGYYVLQSGGPGADLIRGDAEQVLPVALSVHLTAGVRGVVITGLIAAAMSTFASTLNAGASFIVRDVYQTYINPGAEASSLVKVSRVATAGLCAAGILLAAAVPNVNTIWGLITMGIGAGMFIPLFLRWYWPRFNGYGFAAGTAAGVAAGLLFKGYLNWPVYQSFPLTIGLAFIAAVVTSYMTPAPSGELLTRFWVQINPWGFWGRQAKEAVARGWVTEADINSRRKEKKTDAISLLFSVPFQMSMLLGALSFVFHDWGKLLRLVATAAACAIALYFFWYRRLKSPEECAADDAAHARREAAPWDAPPVSPRGDEGAAAV